MTDPVTPPTGSGRPDGSAELPPAAQSSGPATSATSSGPATSAETATSAASAETAETAVFPLGATVPFPISEADTDVLPFDATDPSGSAATAVLPAEPVIPEFTAYAGPRETGVPPEASAGGAADGAAGGAAGATATPPPVPPTPPTARSAPTPPAYLAPGESAAEAWPTAPVRRRHPLFGTIFWGTVMLAFSGFIIYRTLVPGETDPALWLLGGVILMGLVLIVAGIAAAARRAT
jgi:hypothetical protein